MAEEILIALRHHDSGNMQEKRLHRRRTVLS
jgi:hypothetical protein